MNSLDFVPYLKQRDDSSAIKKLFSQLKIKQGPKLKGDPTALLNLFKEGIALVFRSADEKTTKPSGLVLVEVQLYCGVASDFSPFAGKLPKDLSFSDMQKEARKKLGKPTDSAKDLRMDIWDYPTYRLALKFRKDDGKIGRIHLGLPC